MDGIHHEMLSLEESVVLDRPTPPPQFACTLPPPPITPPLDNIAASPVGDSLTDQIDPLSLPNPASSGIRCRTNNPGPAATPSPPPSAEIARSEGIARQIRRQQVAGGILDRERAGQQTSGHTSSISDPGQQIPSDRQPFLPATSFFHPSDVLEPSLLVQEVQPRCNSTFGKGVGSLEGGRGLVFATRSEPGVLRINAPRTPSTSDSGVQHISGKSRGPYEKTRARARIADREVQINALEMKISDLKATFEAESQEKYAAIIDHFNGRILAVQKEMSDRLNDVLGRAPGSGRCCYDQPGETSGC